jgi:hypothetical protein
LQKVDDSGIAFRWRDYRDNNEKVMTLEGVEFLRRSCQHILPKGCARIRHFGLLSTTKRPMLHQLQQASGIKPVQKRKNTPERNLPPAS